MHAAFMPRTGPQGAQGSAGAQGPTGPTGPTGATGQGWNFRGAWQASTAYALYDVVTYNGSTYTPVTAFTSASTFNSANWIVLAQGGSTEIQRSQSTSRISGLTSTTFAQIDSLALSAISEPSVPVEVELYIPLMQVGSASEIVYTAIQSSDGATQYGGSAWFPGVAFAEKELRLVVPFDPPVSLPALRAAYKVSTSNVLFDCGSGSGAQLGPMFLRAKRI